MSLNGIYKVQLEEKTVGEVSVKETGLYVLFEMTSEIPDMRIYRLYCCGDSGCVQVGVAMPDGERLRVCKKFTKTELIKSGITEITGCFLSAKSEFTQSKAKTPAKDPKTAVYNETQNWKRAENVPELFAENDIKEVCRDVKNALLRQDGDITYLAIPANAEEPFPMMPVFCFGEERSINGSEYIIFRIKSGKLY